MKFKYALPVDLVYKVAGMKEFANGATQVTVRLKDGREIFGVLVSNATYLVATRGYKDLPFQVGEIEDLYQRDEDRSPCATGWFYWDDWKL